MSLFCLPAAPDYSMKIPFLSRFATDSLASATPKIAYVASVSAGNKARFGSLLTSILRDLPDLIAVSVIDLRAGRLLATYHAPGKLNPAKAAAHNAEVIRQKQKALEAMSLTEESIEDVLITLTTQWHLLRLLPGNRHVVHLLVGMRDTNLGIAREVLRAHAMAAE